MSTNTGSEPAGQTWESVHVCPKCGSVINLAEIDLRAITTGIVCCSQCEWSGQIEIRIVDSISLKEE
jgi:transcription elongation factor Elf1